VTLAEHHPGKIDLLLADVVMPGNTGPEVARRIQAGRPSTKVIYISGYSEHSTAIRGFLDPEITFLQKPFSPETVAAKVREVLGPSGPKGTILVADEEVGVRDSFRKFLSFAGYEVLEAANGIDVAEHLRASMVDVVILELGMAQRTGLSQAGILSNRPELRIIATYAQPSDLACAANFKVIASFAKPVGAEELLSLIGQILAE